MQIPPLSTLPQLRGLLEVTRLVREEHDLARLVDRTAEAISESLGFRTVSISLYRPAADDFEVTAFHGDELAREAILGTTRGSDAWSPFSSDPFLRRGAYLAGHDEAEREDVPFHVANSSLDADPATWQPETALIVPMYAVDESLLGVISVGDPDSGSRPTDATLDVLAAVAAHVGTAVEAVQSAAATARHRGALEQLLRVSSQLPDARSSEELLQLFCDAIRNALGFQNVAAELFDDSAGYFRAWASVGWAVDGPELRTRLTRPEAAVLLDAAFEQEGCFVLPLEAALARLPEGRAAYASRLNGVGPRAWNRHWLIVPLRHRNGELLGYVWVDDPADRLLPSRDVLTLLRTFANQAAAGLHAAADFQQLASRNDELAALHETTVALLAGLQVDSVLDAILSSATALLSAPFGFLYLPTDDGEELELRVHRGLEEFPPSLKIRRGQGVTGQVFETGEAVFVEDYASWNRRLPNLAGAPFTNVLAVPLRAGGELLGVLGVAMDGRGKLDAADAALLERFAQLAALALENARLYTAAQRELDERRGAEEALRRSEELHRHVVDGSTDLIALLDPKGRIVLASSAYVHVLGHSRTALVGSKLADLVHPEDLAAVRTQVVDGALVEPVTARLRANHGHWVLVEGTATPIRGDTGGIELVLVIARDVTERLRLEEQLRQGQKMESIGRLAGGIAHDFNNLLTAINGYAELMLMDFDAGTVPARDSAEQIARAAGRAASLTSQLLAFSRKQVLRPQVIDLNEVVGGMAAMLARMLGEDVVLSTAFDPELGVTRADPTQVEQVVLNLALNGRDAMPNGGNLELRTGSLELAQHHERPHPDLEPGSYVTLAVSDTGVGIEPSLIEKVFEPFFTTKGVGEGTGLGLATVHGIVSQTGGVVWVESTPGAGTTFTVCLPVCAS